MIYVHASGESKGICRDCLDDSNSEAACGDAESADESNLTLRDMCAWCGHSIEEAK